ncbi:hypothetical protein [Peribacillus alkalitolerans]|nr:hypothetical protein [Peribacillus alkalitolerans]
MSYGKKWEVGEPTGGNADETPIPHRGKQVPLAAINGQTLYS